MVIDRSEMFSRKIVENQTLLPYKEILTAIHGHSPELQAQVLKSWSTSKHKRKKK